VSVNGNSKRVSGISAVRSEKANDLDTNAGPANGADGRSTLRDTMHTIHQCIDPSDNFIGIEERDLSPESARYAAALMARVRSACDGLETRLMQSLPESRTAERPAGATGRCCDRLSQREWEIARLLVDGCTNVNIAARCGVSPNTVRTLMRRLYRKLGVFNRAELVRAVMRSSPGAVER
jgi:DNA-binding NarL/FixJ family response regulator